MLYSENQPPSNEVMITRRRAWAFVFPVLLAFLLRFPLLEQRPMHCDEAVHAVKFGELLEQGKYEYSTVDYHGPTLYYATLLSAKLQGIVRYVDLNERTFRRVTAAAGLLLVAAHVFLIPYLGFPASFCAALLAALSPAMVYYSRYFIHETLLVLLTFCALLSVLLCRRRGGAAWMVNAGLCLGLMFATKETAIIAYACTLLGMLALILVKRAQGESLPGIALSGWHLMLAAAAFTAIAALFYSAFLSHPAGIIDSILAYKVYFWRGSGQDTFHVHPWHYYLNLLLCFRVQGGPVWTEGAIAVLALIGGAAAFKKGVTGIHRDLSRFLAFYTLVMAVIYSVIPYKAPWNLLGFLHGMILLAGLGAGWLVRSLRRPLARGAAVALLAGALVHLGWEAWACSFRYGADPRNPWVYAHTGQDVFPIIGKLEALAKAHPDHAAMPVQIISRENLWPLPWYLRRFQAVQWWNGVSDTAPIAPVILITPDMEPALVRRLYEVPPPGQREMYVNAFDRYVELRPQVEIRVFAAKSLWDEYQRLEAAAEDAASQFTARVWRPVPRSQIRRPAG
jgi:uncharacterized protein (TIGR03663 family)